MNVTKGYLDYAGIARELGIGIESARSYAARAKRHRKLAEMTGDKSHVRPGDLPEPDAHFHRSPLWKESTIKRWKKDRPGQGAWPVDRKPRNERKKTA